MAWRFHSRATVDPSAPRAFGICDRCGFTFNLQDLKWQHDWRGDALVNTRVRVCTNCLDKPFELQRPLRLPPDPEPVLDARPATYYVDEAGGGGVVVAPVAVFWDEPNCTWDDGISTWDKP